MAIRAISQRPGRVDFEAGQTAIGKIVDVFSAAKVAIMIGDSAPIIARVAETLSSSMLKNALKTKQDALVVHHVGESAGAVVVALLAQEHEDPGAAIAQTPPLKGRSIEALMDGRRVEILAEDEIVLKCGKASITLRRNGRVVIRGVHVESDSQGVNRIKGGTVKIN